MTSSSQLYLAAFMRPASIHTGAWRYPGAWPDMNFNFAHLKRCNDFNMRLDRGVELSRRHDREIGPQ